MKARATVALARSIDRYTYRMGFVSRSHIRTLSLSLFRAQDAGEKAAIENAIVSIDNCFREPQGRDKCRSVNGAYDLPQPKSRK